MSSVVAPVSTLSGFIVILPQSLVQISRRISSLTTSFTAGLPNAFASARTRGARDPSGSPRINRSSPCTATTPGSGVHALACTTQPTTHPGATARATAPSGSTDARARPSCITPGTWKYHHGIPLSAGTTIVSAPHSAAMADATAGIACPFTAATTQSCAPNCAGSCDAFRRWTVSVPPRRIRKPFARNAASVSSRAKSETSCPASASMQAIHPPMAPAPTMLIFI